MLSSFSLPLTPPPSCVLYRSSYKGTTLAAGIRRRRPAPLVQPAIVSVGREEDVSIPLSDRNASRSIVSPSAYICLSAQRIFMSARRHITERGREKERENSPFLYGLITVGLSARASIATRHRSTTEILNSMTRWSNERYEFLQRREIENCSRVVINSRWIQ